MTRQTSGVTGENEKKMLTMHDPDWTTFTFLLTLLVMPAWALSGSGTSDAPYLIGSTADWKAFVTMLTDKEKREKCEQGQVLQADRRHHRWVDVHLPQ